MSAAQSTKILLVDDDELLHERVGEFLSAHGFVCGKLTEPRCILEKLASFQPDIVLLDVTMPGEDGFSVLLKIRDVSRVPVIMLTARGLDTDRIIGLELGADDYLAKPFNPRELLARIKAVLRRSPASTAVENGPAGPASSDSSPEGASALTVAFSAGEVRVGSYLLDTRRQTLTYRDNTTSLSTAELCVLHTFLTHAGEALGRDQLMSLAFGNDSHATARSVDVQISRLRAILRDLGDEATRIRTVWGTGYCWLEE